MSYTAKRAKCWAHAMTDLNSLSKKASLRAGVRAPIFRG